MRVWRRELNKHGGAVQNFAFQLSLAGAVATNNVQVHAGLHFGGPAEPSACCLSAVQVKAMFALNSPRPRP